MNKPKVSVIIPVYNTEAYVEEAVRSIMTQTLRDIEILVVDDGSTDQSLTILERLAKEDDRITLISQNNRGLSEARNAGLDQAHGAYIYFMDSDDLLEADAMELCYNRAEAEQLDLVIFDATSFGTDDAAQKFTYSRIPIVGTQCKSGRKLLAQMLEKKCYRASVCLNFIRYSYLLQIKLRFSAGILHEDELFTPQLYLGAARIAGINRNFFHRRMRLGSIMNNDFSERNINGYMTVIRDLHEFGQPREKSDRVLINKIIHIIFSGMMTNAWQMPFKIRWSIAREAFRHMPHRIPVKPFCIMLFKKSFKRMKK